MDDPEIEYLANIYSINNEENFEAVAKRIRNLLQKFGKVTDVNAITYHMARPWYHSLTIDKKKESIYHAILSLPNKELDGRKKKKSRSKKRKSRSKKRKSSKKRRRRY